MPAFCDTPTLKEVLIFWCLSLKQQKCPAGPSKPVESYWCIPNLTCTRITIQLWDGWKRLSGVCFHRGVFFHLLMLTLPAAMCERRKLGLQLAAAATTVHLPTATLCICDLSTAYQTGENVLLLQMTANKKTNKKNKPSANSKRTRTTCNFSAQSVLNCPAGGSGCGETDRGDVESGKSRLD